MQINYRIFNHWRDLDACTQSKDFICRETCSGQIVALDYPAMRKLFLLSSKAVIIETTAELLSELENALDTGTNAGVINL